MPRATDIRGQLRAARRRFSPPSTVWERALPSELAFWARYIETGGLDAPQELKARLDPATPILDPYLVAAIDRSGADPVGVLDVGAGPITSIGYRHPEDTAQVRIAAVDPLGDQYTALLRQAGLEPPVITESCRGEDVAARFGEDAFDIAYSRNALDHAADPISALRAMLRVVRPGGAIVLVHGRREAEARDYEELHQWNFDLQDGRFVLYGKRRSYDIGQEFAGRAQIATDTFSAGEYGDWVVATITKEPGGS